MYCQVWARKIWGEQLSYPRDEVRALLWSRIEIPWFVSVSEKSEIVKIFGMTNAFVTAVLCVVSLGAGPASLASVHVPRRPVAVPTPPHARAAGAVSNSMALPDCAGKPIVKPSSIVLTCADAGVSASGITWTGWGSTFAAGKGIASVNGCQPSCVAGRFTKYKIVLIADGAQRCPNGQKAYARITEAWIGRSPYSGNGAGLSDPTIPYPCR